MAAQEHLVSENEIQSLIESIINATSEVISDDFEVSFIKLQEQAKLFVTKYDQLKKIFSQQQSSQFKSLLKAYNFSDTGNSVIKKIQSMSNDKRIFNTAKYSLAFQFDMYLTRFRGERPREVAYVHISETGAPVTYSIPLQQLALLVNAKNQILPSEAVLKQFGTLESELKNNLKDDNKEQAEQQKHIQVAQTAYMGTAKRLDQFHKKHPQYTGTNGLIMWKMQRAWQINIVNGYGDLKEAYVAALMTKHQSDLDKLCGISLGEPPFQSHDLVSTFFNNYVTKVTALAAIIEEDVVTDERQFAVKGSYGSWPSFNQYYKVAQYIASSPTALTQQDIKDFLLTNKNWTNNQQRNKLLGTIDELGYKKLDELLDNASKETNKIQQAAINILSS